MIGGRHRVLRRRAAPARAASSPCRPAPAPRSARREAPRARRAPRRRPGVRVARHLDAREVGTVACVSATQGRARAAARDRARRRRPRRGTARRHAASQLGRRAARDHAAAVEIDQAIAARHLVEIARADDDQRVAPPAVEDVPDLAARHDVDAGGRLVQHEQLRLRQQRVHDRELLLHATRERPGGAVDEARQAGALEERQRRGARARPPASRCRRAVKRRFSITERSRCRLNACGT